VIYGIVFEAAPDGQVGAYLPDMPGVAVVAQDRQAAMDALDVAVRWHVDGMIEDGTPIPDASPGREYESFIILDRTYVDHIPEALRAYISSPSNASASTLVTHGFLGGASAKKAAIAA
jgi:predicted RNase H-like HicB family nuclease